MVDEMTLTELKAAHDEYEEIQYALALYYLVVEGFVDIEDGRLHAVEAR